MHVLFDPGIEAAVIWLAVLASLVAVAVYMIARLRPAAAQQERLTSRLLAKFREMHSRGELSDEEFRTIKTALAAQVLDELNHTAEKG